MTLGETNSYTDDAWLENLKREHQRTVANLKDGGPPVNHHLIDRYIAGLLEEPALTEVIMEITSWKSWFEAEKEMRSEVYVTLRDWKKNRSQSLNAAIEGSSSNDKDVRSYIPGNEPLSHPQRGKGRRVLLMFVVTMLSAIGLFFVYPVMEFSDDVIGVHRRGFGFVVLGGVSDQQRARAVQIASSAKLHESGIRDTLNRIAGPLMSAQAVERSTLRPNKTAIIDSNVLLTWNGFHGHDHYSIEVIDVTEDSTTPSIYNSNAHEHSLSLSLKPGRVYKWKVTGYLNDERFSPTGSEQMWSAFRVLSEEERNQLSNELLTTSGSRLLQADIYSKYGVIDQAEMLVRQLAIENPSSRLLPKLIQGLQ